MNTLSKKAILEFQQIYRETYGQKISYDEALQKAISLLNFFREIYKPMVIRSNKS